MKKMNNKGFSLVELIIVIAIMVILIGVLAPQYIKYVEKSRVSADKDLLDSVYTACTTAAADPDFSNDAPAYNTSSANSSIATSNSWGSEVLNTLGVSTFSDVESKLKSKSAGNAIVVSTDSQGNFTVTAGSLSVPEK